MFAWLLLPPLLLGPHLLATALPQREAPTPPDEQGEGIEVAVTWAVSEATPGCFFFSGPGRLGRNDSLGSRACVTPGPRPVISFGSAVFHGSPRGIQRRSTHVHGGPWTVDEALSGGLSGDGRFEGAYQYTECQQGSPCPGHCRIRATVSFTPIGRCGDAKGAPRS